MNNDLENLLASLPRPTPSTDLDRRIAAVRLPERLRDDVIPSQRWFSRLIVTATCAAISGFALGRISAPVAPAETGQAVSPDTRTPAGAEIASVTIQLPANEAVANFLMPPRQHTPLF